jgi:hypothetical protein
VVARLRSRRASGTLTLTRPGSSPGDWSSAVAGSLPVSRQAKLDRGEPTCHYTPEACAVRSRVRGQQVDRALPIVGARP